MVITKDAQVCNPALDIDPDVSIPMTICLGYRGRTISAYFCCQRSRMSYSGRLKPRRFVTVASMMFWSRNGRFPPMAGGMYSTAPLVDFPAIRGGVIQVILVSFGILGLFEICW